MTLREELGEPDSILSMKLSYPSPFCTTNCAAPTTSAVLGLASNVCGSVFGLLSIAVTFT